MADDLKKVAEDLRSAWEGDLKPRIEQMEAEAKATGEAHAETKQAIDRVQDRMDQFEAQLTKASLAPKYSENEMSPERKAHVEFLRKGIDKMDPEEAKVLRLSDETQGGVLAPTDFIADVVKGIVQYSPIRAIARVKPTSRTSSSFPKRTQTGAAVWTGDTQTRGETPSPRYGLDEIPNHELYARVLVSNWDLEDPVVDLESEVRDDMAEQFGVSEGAGFVSGNSVGKPEGFLVNTDVEQVLNGGADFSTVKADGLIKLTYQLKEQYWPNARFVMHRFTLRDLRLVKDTTNNYIWAPGLGPGTGLTGGMPPTLLGYEYTIAVDMPTIASNALPVAFGDFKRGYWISDRIQIQYLRDPFTAANAGAVVFHTRKRVGGQVVLPEAIKILKMA